MRSRDHSLVVLGSHDHSLVVLGSMSHRSVQWVTNLHLLHFANLQSGETTSWIPAQHGRVWTERTFSGHFQSHSPFWPKTHHGCSAQQTGDLVWKSSAHYSQRERRILHTVEFPGTLSTLRLQHKRQQALVFLPNSCVRRSERIHCLCMQYVSLVTCTSLCYI